MDSGKGETIQQREMKLLEALPYLERKEEPKRDDFDYEFGGSDFVRAKEKHQKTWHPIESLEWKDFNEVLPEIGCDYYCKWVNSHVPTYVYTWNEKSTFTGGEKWIESSLYESALAQEKKLCALGEGWERVNKNKWIKSDFTLWREVDHTFSLSYKHTHLASWHESICQVQMVLDVIKQIEI